jgi:hypothetical protein
MHVPQKRACGALKSDIAPPGHSLSASCSHDVKPYVASLIPWSTWHDTVEFALRSLRFWGIRHAPAVQALLDLRSTAGGDLTGTLRHEAGTPDTRTAQRADA